MATWRGKEVNAARLHQEKRVATRLGKLCSYVHGSVEPAKRYQIRLLVNEPKESCTDAKRTETCVAPS